MEKCAIHRKNFENEPKLVFFPFFFHETKKKIFFLPKMAKTRLLNQDSVIFWTQKGVGKYINFLWFLIENQWISHCSACPCGANE